LLGLARAFLSVERGRVSVERDGCGVGAPVSQVVTPQRSYVLVAQDDAERDEWVFAIRTNRALRLGTATPFRPVSPPPADVHAY
jgi:hypothetical protein